MNDQENNFEMITRDVEGLVKVHRIKEYKGYKIFTRQIFESLFEYILTPVDTGDIYSSYIIITPEEGKDDLTEEQVNQAVGVIMSGAEATIDTLIDMKQEKEKQVSKNN